jgi:hypothetical protein
MNLSATLIERKYTRIQGKNVRNSEEENTIISINYS